jgi:hypothetical protein
MSDLDPVRVNPRGGAIAIGHPLGASGARLTGAVAHRLAAAGSGTGLVVPCIGVGQGLALVREGRNRVTTPHAPACSVPPATPLSQAVISEEIAEARDACAKATTAGAPTRHHPDRGHAPIAAADRAGIPRRELPGPADYLTPTGRPLTQN